MRVTADRLNVRGTPAIEPDNVLGGLEQGQVVSAVGRSGDWVQIVFGAGRAFVNKTFVEPVTSSAPSNPAASHPISTATSPAQTSETAATPAAVTPGSNQPAPAAAQTAAEPAVHVVAPESSSPAAHAPGPGEGTTTSVPTTKPITPPLQPPGAAGARSLGMAGERPPAGSFTPNTADHTPAATPYAGTMDARGGRALTDASYMSGYHHLAGGASLSDAPTKPAEGEILNKIRLDNRQIDPASLRVLQNRLGIKNVTGAMNTETLRKLMQDHHPFSVEALLSGKMLGADLTILTRAGNGYGAHGDGHTLRDNSPVAEGEHKADAMARVAGFADYAEMKASFVTLELFGQPLGRGLPFLAQRLKLADAYLRQRIPEADGVTDQKKLKAIAQEKLQWDGSGNGAYADNLEDIAKASGGRYGAHFHASGLAIDINPSKNPYVFVLGSMTTTDSKTKKIERTIDGVLADHLRYAAQIYGGEEVTPTTMMDWSKHLSSEELAAKIDMVSHSLNLYLTLCETGTDDEIKTRFRNAGYAPDKATELVIAARKFGKKAPDTRRYWQDNLGRDRATGLTTHSMDMIVALRDVAGLSWGGTEMSEGSSGDFMHFDCRGTDVGKKLFAFAMHNRGAERAPTPTHPDATHRTP
ncbi:MAG TPA: hypothetical protein VFP84_16240 [Kofleriaceae bacterium]|nr:hypothetical protein [Kofleriaceae bacterium]